MKPETGEKCGACRRPVHGAFLCEPCLDELEDVIGDLPALAHALDACYLRQQRFGVTSITIANPEEASVPFNEKAGRLRRELSRELTRWVLQIENAHGVCWIAGNAPAGSRIHIAGVNTTESMSGSLLWALPYFRANQTGPSAHRTFTSLHTRILKVVDRPPDLVFLGICSYRDPDADEDCTEDLYAEWGKDFATCRKCKHHHRVTERRSTLIAAVRDQLATASDVARGLSGLDMKVTAERIRQWKHRGRIFAHVTTHDGVPLYRVGDVIDLVLAEKDRKPTPTPERKPA
jgi:hypothetical protein